ncbi:MAG: glycosyltransferase [Gammaproteobacteria bacterium]|nr:glycosyltransferase [Gammaproteobacteria bacterium]MCF6363876.1 glycosyltransferase [Gammaproteobacteria bacterium]
MKIGVFLPQKNHFYQHIAAALKTAFEAHGLETYCDLALYKPKALSRFCREFKPDCIFEMNRSRSELPELPGSIIHISWIVDLLGRDIDDIQESEIIYFFGTGWKDIHTNKHASLVDWLPAGFCPQTYKLCHSRKTVDFSFIGHIPRPWSSAELERIVGTGDADPYTFEQLFEQCRLTWAKHGGLHQLRPEQYLHLVAEVLANGTRADFRISDRTMKYDIETRSTRMINRQHAIDSALSVSTAISIHGSTNWLEWDRYRPHYRGYLNSHQDIREVYQRSKLNLHEGIGLHFRTLDCMGAGGLLAFKPTSRDGDPDGINSHFEPFRHYIPLDIGGDRKHLKYYLQNEKEISRIAEEASKLAHQQHTWQVRCKKIVADIASL